MRHDGRPNDALRSIKITRNFTTAPAGSVLWEQGKTIVMVTASLTPSVPPWFPPDREGGWVTADYVMLPGSTARRKDWPKSGHTDARGTEIQRLIGRCIRAAVDLSRIGPHTIALDCQVLQADGGTRTASICAAYVALVDAINKLPQTLKLAPDKNPQASYDPSRAIVDQLAAVSVGVVEGEVRLDLDYIDDSRAGVDMNVCSTASGKIVEVQSAAENGQGFERVIFNDMLDLAISGSTEIMRIQNVALGGGTR